MHTDGAAPRRVVTGPAGQRDYELMALVPPAAVHCSLLHWFKPGRAVGRARRLPGPPLPVMGGSAGLDWEWSGA